jgi:hypothetical protein
MSLINTDPDTWPIITNVYRYMDVNWPDNIIYTACRYEKAVGYKLMRCESDHYCLRCGNSVSDSFGVIMYTRDGRCTVPMYVCIGCYEFRELSGRPMLSWRYETVYELVDKITISHRGSSGLLQSLNEILTTIRLRGRMTDRVQIPPEFTALYRFAKKL